MTIGPKKQKKTHRTDSNVLGLVRRAETVGRKSRNPFIWEKQAMTSGCNLMQNNPQL